MSLYYTALFLHIVGALGLFAALALEWAGLSNLRRARTGGRSGTGRGYSRAFAGWEVPPASPSSSPVFT
jgi:hypothetical protein